MEEEKCRTRANKKQKTKNRFSFLFSLFKKLKGK